MNKVIFVISMLVIALSVIIKEKLFEYNILCSSQQVLKYVQNELCNKHSHIVVPIVASMQLHPPLCEVLCSNNVTAKCQSYHLSKPTVFQLTNLQTAPSKLIIKEIIDYEQNGEIFVNGSDLEFYQPTNEELDDFIRSHINLVIGRDSLNVRIPKHTLNSMHKDYIKSYQYLWKFLNDHEYIFLYIFEELGIFPKLYGSCGKFYAVEYINLTWNDATCSNNYSKDCLHQMYSLVKYIETIESIWDEPFDLCDVKPEHFGWNDRGDIVFLDLDSVETTSALANIMKLTPQCLSDEDCSYFDCEGKCLASGKCDVRRVNTNLQVICQKIFVSHSYSYLSHTANEMSPYFRDAIELCATNPGMSTSTLLNVFHEEMSLFNE